ncbi:hypothetical protein ACWDA7_01265 [Streptomyces sp. NPDC001156]
MWLRRSSLQHLDSMLIGYRAALSPGAESDPAEVVPAQDTATGAEEDELGPAGTGVLGKAMSQLLDELA